METTSAHEALQWVHEARHKGALDLDAIPRARTECLDDNQLWELVDHLRVQIHALDPALGTAEAALALFYALRQEGLKAQFVLAKEISPASDSPSITTWVEIDTRVISTGLDVKAGWEPMGRLGADLTPQHAHTIQLTLTTT